MSFVLKKTNLPLCHASEGKTHATPQDGHPRERGGSSGDHSKQKQ